jgi:hypothetical protein
VSARVQRILGALALFALVASPARAQQRGGGGGGRGRGRGPIVVMTLTSSAFADGARIPEKYAQPGHELSPPLSWTGAPDSTVSFVLIVHDLDSVIGNGTDDMLHWMVWNILGAATSLAEGIPALPQLPDGTRQVSATGPYYRAPGAPASGPPHHYAFELYALDIALDVGAVVAAPPVARASVIAAMASHIRGKATLVGLYRRGS